VFARHKLFGGFHGHGHGMEFQGTNGSLVLTRGGWNVLAEKSGDTDRVKPEKHGSSDRHFPHVQNFIDCIKRT